jgi:hypothetical protein
MRINELLYEINMHMRIHNQRENRLKRVYYCCCSRSIANWNGDLINLSVVVQSLYRHECTIYSLDKTAYDVSEDRSNPVSCASPITLCNYLKTEMGSAFETSEAVRIFNQTMDNLQRKHYHDENQGMFIS